MLRTVNGDDVRVSGEIKNIGPSRGSELGGLEGERVSEDSNYVLKEPRERRQNQ